MRLVSVAGRAVPDISLLAVAVGDLVEAVIDAAMMRIQSACQAGIRDETRPGRVIKVVEDLESLVAFVLGGVVEGLAHVAQDRPAAELQLGVITGDVLPGEAL